VRATDFGTILVKGFSTFDCLLAADSPESDLNERFSVYVLRCGNRFFRNDLLRNDTYLDHMFGGWGSS
jgi:hypothetical protein